MSARMGNPYGGATGPVHLACCYRRTWDDGFGARGWKLARALADPEVIASTPATGERIPTSVFVHDTLDHALCGLGTSGHRDEAVALMLLAERTGADPTPDFEQMVEEDLLQGRAVGETLRAFLPPDLSDRVPLYRRSDAEVMTALSETLSAAVLKERLVGRFFELGRAGAPAGRRHYWAQGLDPARRRDLGLTLQRLFERTDALVQSQDWGHAEGAIVIGPKRCALVLHLPEFHIDADAY
jgi:hypothetical protein